MNNNNNEIWRGYPGFENDLEVSNFGRIRRKARPGWDGAMIEAKLIKIVANRAATSINCTPMSFPVKEAVARVFMSGYSDNMVVITIGDKKDFHVENLRIVSAEEAEEIKLNKNKTRLRKRTIPKEGIVQKRLSGEIVRRYYNLDEILEVHPLWKQIDLILCLQHCHSTAYCYRWEYEAENIDKI